MGSTDEVGVAAGEGAGGWGGVGFMSANPCPECNGTGKHPEWTCDPCNGTGTFPPPLDSYADIDLTVLPEYAPTAEEWAAASLTVRIAWAIRQSIYRVGADRLPRLMGRE